MLNSCSASTMARGRGPPGHPSPRREGPPAAPTSRLAAAATQPALNAIVVQWRATQQGQGLQRSGMWIAAAMGQLQSLVTVLQQRHACKRMSGSCSRRHVLHACRCAHNAGNRGAAAEMPHPQEGMQTQAQAAPMLTARGR